MSTERDLTRIVRSWMRDDEHESADRVLDAVLDQLDTTPQRRAGWWPAWRSPTMNRFLTIGLGTAAVVVIAVLLGTRLLGSPSGTGGPGDEPTASAEASSMEPTSEPTPEPTPAGLLPEGPFVLTDESIGPGLEGLPMTVTIPAPDWYGEPGYGILTKGDNADPPDGAGLIVFAVADGYYVYGDPCRWSTTRPETPATTVDELVAALAAQASRDASEPVDITLDGYAGKAITLHVPDDQDLSDCDQATFGSWGLPGADQTPMRYHQGPGQIDNMWVLDVTGHIVVIDWGHYAGTPQDVVDELQAIVESTTFGEAP